ncbi:G-protein associated signal transduction protein, putative, partial [Plasmodium malariae]
MSGYEENEKSKGGVEVVHRMVLSLGKQRHDWAKLNNVNLLDNIIGDILTSLSKTFSDVQNGMNTSAQAKCPILERYITPVFLGLPFYLRLCQCLIRRTDSHIQYDEIYVWNSYRDMEYFGLDVYTSKIILICAYVVGSTYMYIWDLYCDWGLLKEYNYLLRKSNNLMYPPHYYYLAGFLNLVILKREEEKKIKKVEKKMKKVEKKMKKKIDYSQMRDTFRVSLFHLNILLDLR